VCNGFNNIAGLSTRRFKFRPEQKRSVSLVPDVETWLQNSKLYTVGDKRTSSHPHSCARFRI